MSVPNAFTTVTSATGAQLDANFAACNQLNATNVLATDGDQQVVSQGSTNGKLRTGTCSATSGNLFTVFGSSVVEYTSYNVPISSVGAFGACDISGVCWIRGVTATGIEKWYTATGTASVAPSTGSFTLYKSYNIATGAEIFVVPPSAPGFVQGQTLIPTAAGTTTLTASSTYEQIFQGSTTQTCVMPVVSTLTAGQSFWLKNESTGAVTVNSSGSNLIVTLNSGDQALITSILITGTTAASWDLQINAQRNGDVTQTMLVAPATLSTQAVQASQLFGFRNKIINGACNIAQRGTAAVTATSYSYNAVDRFGCLNSTGSGTIQQSQGSLTYNGITYNTTRATCTSSVTLTSGSAIPIEQRIEGQNVYTLANQPMMLSFIANTNMAGTNTFCATISDAAGTTNTFISPFTLTGGTPKLIQIPIVAGNLTIPNSNAIGLTIYIAPITNSGSLSSTYNTWFASPTGYVATSAVNWAVTGNYVEATQIQLESGTVATPFEQRPYGLELSLCQRYFLSMPIGSYNHCFMAFSTSAAYGAIPLPVPSRVPFTTITGVGGTLAGTNAFGGYTGTASVCAASSTTHVCGQVTGATVVQGNPVLIGGTGVTAIQFSGAEL